MFGTTEQLKDEFVKLIDYLAKNSKLRNGVNGSPNRSSGSQESDTSPSGNDVSREDSLSDKLEQDLISLLGEYNINKRSKTDLDGLLSELESYFSKNKRVPFKHVKNLIKSIDTSTTNLESVLELLNLLKNNYLASSLGSMTPKLTSKSMKNKHVFKETPPENGDEYRSDDLLSSQLRELYYSPLPVEKEPVESQSPPGSMFDFEYQEDGFRESDVVMDMIYVLKGLEPKYFKKVGDNYFLTSSNLKLSRDMRHLTSRICTVAKMYHSIKAVSLPKSPVMDALFQAVVEELDGFTKLVDLLFLNFGDEYISLLQLYSLLHRPYPKIRLIYNLVNTNKLSLENVYDGTFRGDVLSRDLFTRLLRRSLVPFFEVVYKWLYLGDLSPKTTDFFVSEFHFSNTANNTNRDNNNHRNNNNNNEDTHYYDDYVGDSGDDFCFNESKVYRFFPLDLAKSIFHKGRLSHYLKKLRKKTVVNLSFKTFLERVCGDHGWSLNESLRCLEQMVSDLNYSVDLASVLKEEYELTNYFTALCCQFVYFNTKDDNDFKRYMKPSYDMSEAFEQSQMVFYPNPKFPYSLIIGNNYEFYKNMIKLSALFRVAVDKLNQVFSEYLYWNKYNKGVLELSPFFNKVNFYRSEMVNFLFSLQPFTDARFHFELFLESLVKCTDLQDMRRCNNNFVNDLINNQLNYLSNNLSNSLMINSVNKLSNNSITNLSDNLMYKLNNSTTNLTNSLTDSTNKHLFTELVNLLKNVIDFCNCLSDVYKQDMNRLHSSLDSSEPDDLVNFLDNELVDYSTSWSCLKSAELFRNNALKILNKLGKKKYLVDFNDYYKLNYRLK